MNKHDRQSEFRIVSQNDDSEMLENMDLLLAMPVLESEKDWLQIEDLEEAEVFDGNEAVEPSEGMKNEKA